MMNRKMLGFAAAAVMTAAMCGNVLAGEADGEPIRIGLSTPITGNFAENGEGTRVAVEMAVEGKIRRQWKHKPVTVNDAYGP